LEAVEHALDLGLGDVLPTRQRLEPAEGLRQRRLVHEAAGTLGRRAFACTGRPEAVTALATAALTLAYIVEAWPNALGGPEEQERQGLVVEVAGGAPELVGLVLRQRLHRLLAQRLRLRPRVLLAEVPLREEGELHRGRVVAGIARLHHRDRPQRALELLRVQR